MTCNMYKGNFKVLGPATVKFWICDMIMRKDTLNRNVICYTDLLTVKEKK